MAGGGGDGGNEYEVNINLTALLDVLTNLLFFLMVGFAAQQVNLEVKGGVKLPTSTAEITPKKAIKIVIGDSELRVESDTVAAIKDGKIVVAGDDAADKRIEPLYVNLVKLREGLKDEIDTKTFDSPDALYVLCDKETPYALLRRVLTTAAAAGFPKFRMAVLMK
ncbi:MAG TPA: biopolymer transporter ExbD [Myxococcota bacterium]|jgi:biopolymer transport protein ExbD|nr:biopolymer transporter ExbD [Myxococcota bacterium]